MQPEIEVNEESITNCVFMFLSFLIYPFFVAVFRKNQAKDKGTAIYPVFNHFYKSIKKIQIVSGTYVLYFFFTMFMAFFGATFFVFLIPVLLIVFPLVTGLMHEVNEFLLGLLSIQRCCLYFMPNYEKYLNISVETLNVVVRNLYICFIIKSVLLIILPYIYTANIITYTTLILLFQNLFIFFCALLYIPILISIRKARHLSSFKLHRPQNYIMYQLLLALSAKCIYAILIFQSPLHELHEVIPKYLYLDICHVCFFPQISYLLCNKRNWDSLVEILKSENLLKIWCCPCMKSTRIQPTVPPAMQIYSTHAE